MPGDVHREDGATVAAKGLGGRKGGVGEGAADSVVSGAEAAASSTRADDTEPRSTSAQASRARRSAQRPGVLIEPQTGTRAPRETVRATAMLGFAAAHAQRHSRSTPSSTNGSVTSQKRDGDDGREDGVGEEGSAAHTADDDRGPRRARAGGRTRRGSRHAAILQAALREKEEQDRSAAQQAKEIELMQRGAAKVAALPLPQKRVALVRAIERHPENVVLWHMYGVVLYEQAQHEAAELAFENALALNPHHVPSLGAYARLLRERGQDRAAQKLEARERRSRAMARLSSPSTRDVTNRHEAEALLNQVPPSYASPPCSSPPLLSEHVP
jgi:hypothetical protein